MQIRIVYDEKVGQYLDFEAERSGDRTDLKRLSGELTNAGYQFGSISVHNKLQNVKIPCRLKRKEN